MYFMLDCVPPIIKLFPGPSSRQDPLQFRRSQDFYISSVIKLNCLNSLAIKVKWSIFNHTSNGSIIEANIDHSMNTTLTELFVPARAFIYGEYELQLTVTMIASPNTFSSNSSYVKINPSGITANLVQYGTSMVSSGENQNLTLSPGTYSINPDESSFNDSVSDNIYIILRFSHFPICQDWTYSYQCRLYDPINIGRWSPIEDTNGSCFSHRKSMHICIMSLSIFLFR